MEKLNNPESTKGKYVCVREVKEDLQKGNNFKIFLQENDQTRYYIEFEIPSEERNLNDLEIFQSFLKRNFGEDILSKNVNEVFDKLRSIANKIENLND